MNRKIKRKKQLWLRTLQHKLYFLSQDDIRDLVNSYSEQINEELTNGKNIDEVLEGLNIDLIVQTAYDNLDQEEKVSIIHKKRPVLAVIGEILGLPWMLLLCLPIIFIFCFAVPFALIAMYLAGWTWFILRALLAWIYRIFNPRSQRVATIQQSSFFRFPFTIKINK